MMSPSHRIRRAQSTDVGWSSFLDNDTSRRDDDSTTNNKPLHVPDRSSIFRSRPKMSPIGTKKLMLSNDGSSLERTANNGHEIRPSLSCPAAVFESPLKNLLPLQTHRPMELDQIGAGIEPIVAPPEENEEVISRNLNNAFDLLMPSEEEKETPSTTTTAVVKQPTFVKIEHATVPLISLPKFTLDPSLRGSLSDGVLSRVSFYSIVRDINAEASNCLASDPTVPNNNNNHGRHVRAGDGRVHVHPSKDEKSILIDTGTEEEEKEGTTFSSTSLLDEEWFLLSAIASRDSDEVSDGENMGVLPTFAEAMGETPEGGGGGGTSRTQLWKPGRSWWEAKSGKNPWVEPVVHNNRWRYLWPLIHYHKFIAKCIKKLKRNGIDVKSSTSTLSVFLRQEVCHVSDHLAYMSKYDSEEWTSALRNFEGWVDHDPIVEETVRNLVLAQRLVGNEDDSEFDSSLLRSQLDETVLKAMRAVKEEAAKAAASENYDYGKGVGGNSGGGGSAAGRNEENASQGSFSANNQSIHRSWSGSVGPNSAKKKNRGHDGSWRKEYPMSYPNPGMYHPPPPHYSHHYPAMEHQYYHPYEQYPPPPHPHMAYHHGGDMPYEGQYLGHHPYGYDAYYDGSFHDGMMLDNSMHPEYNVHPQAMATPSRYHHEPPQYPVSPFHHDYWGHLNISQLPGLAPSPSMSMHTPSKPPLGNTNRSFRKHQGVKNPPIDSKAKSLIIFPKQASSPASKFLMSPQDKSNPYYSARNFQSSNPNYSTQEESFVLPTIEDFAHGSPMKHHPGHPVDYNGVAQAYPESRNDKVELQSSED